MARAAPSAGALGFVLLLAGCVAAAVTPSATPGQEVATTASLSASPQSSNEQLTTAPSAGPTSEPTPHPTNGLTAQPMPRPTPRPTKAPGCKATDQDRLVYNPDRLEVVAPCIRVTGTVDVIRSEADGDLHILITLDAAFRHLLRPANEGEERGDLVVEPVCVRSVSQKDAIATCRRDHDPLKSLPSAGMHIWLEGCFVHDLDHGGWSELHPLYRWGSL